METKDIHSGHRKRLRDKINTLGIENTPEHEVLELLLTYVIPRKDTNPLAHNILNVYGNLSGVLDASKTDLAKIKGVGAETAQFLTMLPEVFNVYRKSKNKNENKILKNVDDCVKFFRSNFETKRTEVFYAIGLNATGKIVKIYQSSNHDSSSVVVDIKHFIYNIISDNVASIVMFHTHPTGNVQPSRADIDATRELYDVCKLLNMDLVDHIIFNETEHFSLGSNGILDEIMLEHLNRYKNKNSTLKIGKGFLYKDTLENKTRH